MKSQAFYAYEYSGQSHDCGSKLGWLQANIALALKHPELGTAMRDYLKDHA